MITRFGMGSKKIGPVCFHHHDYEQKPYSEETGRIIDLEIQELVHEAEIICEKTLEDNLDKLHEISKDLLIKENINREEFLAYFS
jgi:ATP-dependent Zn protease